MAGGRPLKFTSVEDLQKKIDAYFDSCFEMDKDGVMRQTRPFTVSGLALALDTSRQTLINYEENSEYFDTIKKAKDRVENWTEEQLYRNTQVTGVIFNLKNNWGYKDKQETDVTSNGQSINPVLVKFIDGKDDRNTEGV